MTSSSIYCTADPCKRCSLQLCRFAVVSNSVEANAMSLVIAVTAVVCIQVSVSSLNRHAVATREDVGLPKAHCLKVCYIQRRHKQDSVCSHLAMHLLCTMPGQLIMILLIDRFLSLNYMRCKSALSRQGCSEHREHDDSIWADEHQTAEHHFRQS